MLPDMSILAEHVPFHEPREWLLSNGILIGVTILIALVVLWLSRLAVQRMQRRLEGVESATQELDLQRAATVTQALSYVIRVLVWTVTVLLVLGQFGLNIGPLLAGAGIAGVALGFGAQSLVRDFLSGFFILLENQFAVSDVVTINVGGQQVTGKVETVSLRTTELRDFEGTLHIVPNGNVLLVGNRSRGWARAIIDLRLRLKEDVDKVRGILDELFEEVRSDESMSGAFLSGPDVLGVERFGENDVTLRVTAKVRPTRRADLQRELRQRIKRRFDERGIEIAPAPGASPPL